MTVNHAQMMDTKHCIDLAIDKANIAVKYDTANDINLAIAAYTEAVQLLFNALQQQQQKEASEKRTQESADQHDIDGLTSICNIYMERIDYLSQLKAVLPQEQQHIISSANCASSHKHSKINSVFLNIFNKKSSHKKKKSFNFHSHHRHESQNEPSSPPPAPSPAAISTISSLEDAALSPTQLSLPSSPHPKSTECTLLSSYTSKEVVGCALTNTGSSLATAAANSTHLGPDTTPDSWKRSSSSPSDNFQQYIGKALSLPIKHHAASPTSSAASTVQEQYHTPTNAYASTIYYYQQQQKQQRQQEEENERNSYAESFSLALPATSSSSSSVNPSNASLSSCSSSCSTSTSSSTGSSQHHSLMAQQPCQKQYNMNRNSYSKDEQPPSPASSSFFYLNDTSNNNIPFKRLLKSGGGSGLVTSELNSTIMLIDPNIIRNYPEAKVI